MAKSAGSAALSRADGPRPQGCAGTPESAVRSSFRDRIGADRFSVWFGDAAEIEIVTGGSPAAAVSAGGGSPAAAVLSGGGSPAAAVALHVRVGSGFTHEWLRRTFHGEFLAAARAVCGPAVEVHWEPLRALEGGLGPVPDGTKAAAPVRRDSPRRRREDAADEPVALTLRPSAAVRPARAAATLEEFVAGTSNRMALAAVERVVARPGEMSPLVVHGPTGVGKTHLVEAACARARELHPGLAVACLSAEQFTTGFLQGLHGGGLPGFRRSCRSADLLVIDDIQFLAGKRATTVEFQHTVDTLHRQGRQMIFACDRELDALAGLGADVLTRLRGGMVARIEAPDYDVRRGIVAQLCRRRGFDVPEDVIHHVATHITRHARELYGAVNRLEATSLMLGAPVTLGMAEEALADLVRSSARSVRLADIERAICKAFGLEPGSLQSSRRARSASHPRMLAMFLARKHTHAALADIGRHFGRRSHSTVIAAQKSVGEWLARRTPIVLADADWDVEEAIRRVEELLRAG